MKRSMKRSMKRRLVSVMSGILLSLIRRIVHSLFERLTKLAGTPRMARHNLFKTQLFDFQNPASCSSREESEVIPRFSRVLYLTELITEGSQVGKRH